MSDNTSSTSTLNEALILISSTTVVGVLYTFSLILYSLCARLLYSWLRGLDGKRQTVSTFIVASVVIICGTMDVILNNQFVRIVYVDYSSQPGGPLGRSAQSHASTTLQILNPASLLAEVLTLGVLLWRVWVIYSGTRFAIPIIILPLLIYLACVATNILHLAFIWNPPSSAWSNVTRMLQITSVAALALTVASKIMMTSMIILRLMRIRHKHIELMGKTDVAAQYLGIAAMLIESYALTTAWNIGYLIAFILKNPPTNIFFGRSGAQVDFLSYFLVLYRVFSGRAWSRQTQNQLSTLRWNRRGTQSTEDDSVPAETTKMFRILIIPTLFILSQWRCSLPHPLHVPGFPFSTRFELEVVICTSRKIRLSLQEGSDYIAPFLVLSRPTLLSATNQSVILVQVSSIRILSGQFPTTVFPLDDTKATDRLTMFDVSWVTSTYQYVHFDVYMGLSWLKR